MVYYIMASCIKGAHTLIQFMKLDCMEKCVCSMSRERERERETYTHTHTGARAHTYTHTV